MNTITLQEALERATKGPFEVKTGNFRYIITADDAAVARTDGLTVEHRADAALLAHCWTHLPALVEAVERHSKALHAWSKLQSQSNVLELQAAFDKLEAALRAAQTVKMP